FAVLGILAMNIQSFSMIGIAYVMPYTYGDMKGANYWVWFLCHVFADQKFMTIFSLLFGAGIILMTERQEKSVGRSRGVHYRLMVVLLVFGLIHAYCFWFGDILYTYAICGMLVYPLRRSRPWISLLFGLIIVSVPFWINQYFFRCVDHSTLADFLRDLRPSAAQIQEELQIYRSGWLTQIPARIQAALGMQTFMFVISFGWRAGGLMLIGVALFKLGFFRASWSVTAYWSTAIGGLALGIPLILYGSHEIDAHHWELVYT